MKRISTMLAALAVITMINVASANEYTPAQICQSTDPTDVSYGWTSLYATDSAYVICPVTRTYSSVSTARAYVYNPSNKTTSGYVNFVSLDGSYTNYNSASTSTSGNQTLTFSAINTNGNQGFINFEMTIPQYGSVYGYYSN